MKSIPFFFIIAVMAFCLSYPITASAQTFRDRELLSGMEPIVKYGMDTTQNWWAITEPFSKLYRLTVNTFKTDVYQELMLPVFAPDGERWATLGVKNSQWQLITESGDYPLEYNKAEEIQFSADSKTVAFVGYRGDEAWIVSYIFPDDESGHGKRLKPLGSPLAVSQKSGKFLINQNGRKVAYVGIRSGSKIISVNGVESAVYDDLLPIGFWYDGAILYAGKLGAQWRVYKNEETLTASFRKITEPKINPIGDVAAFIGSYVEGSVVVMIAERYTEPLTGEIYENISDLVLHPTLPMYAYRASYNQVPYIVYSGTRYAALPSTSAPEFSYDGSALIYMGCDALECYLTIDGKRYSLETTFDLSRLFVVVPASETFAYVSSTTLAVRKYTSKATYGGMIVDEMSPPRYNRRNNSYEMLGRISERLYLVSCQL